MAQLANGLLPKHNNLTSDSQTLYRKLGPSAHTHDLSTREADPGGFPRFASQSL